MYKFIILFFLIVVSFVLFSSNVYAWSMMNSHDAYCYTNPEGSAYDPSCPASAKETVLSECLLDMQGTTSYRYYSESQSVYQPGTQSERTTYYCKSYFQNFDTVVDLTGIGTVYNYQYTDEQCQAAYSGGISRIHGATVETAMSGITQGACTFIANLDDLECYNNSGNEFCYSTWELSSSGEVNTVDEPGENVDSEVPEYLEPTTDPASCAAGSVAYDGQSYCYAGGAESYLSHWDSTTETVQPGGVGNANDGSGDGGTGGDDGSTGGDDDGTGGTGGGGGGDGDGDGTGDDGTGTGDDEEEGEGGSWSGSGTVKPFDSGGQADALVADARLRLDTTIADIQAEMAGIYSDVGVAGTCPERSLTFRGSAVDLDFCSKIDEWGGLVRNAVLLLGALLAFGIILRAND